MLECYLPPSEAVIEAICKGVSGVFRVKDEKWDHLGAKAGVPVTHLSVLEQWTEGPGGSKVRDGDREWGVTWVEGPQDDPNAMLKAGCYRISAWLTHAEIPVEVVYVNGRMVSATTEALKARDASDLRHGFPSLDAHLIFGPAICDFWVSFELTSFQGNFTFLPARQCVASSIEGAVEFSLPSEFRTTVPFDLHEEDGKTVMLWDVRRAAQTIAECLPRERRAPDHSPMLLNPAEIYRRFSGRPREDQGGPPRTCERCPSTDLHLKGQTLCSDCLDYDATKKANTPAHSVPAVPCPSCGWAFVATGSPVGSTMPCSCGNGELVIGDHSVFPDEAFGHPGAPTEPPTAANKSVPEQDRSQFETTADQLRVGDEFVYTEQRDPPGSWRRVSGVIDGDIHYHLYQSDVEGRIPFTIGRAHANSTKVQITNRLTKPRTGDLFAHTDPYNPLGLTDRIDPAAKVREPSSEALQILRERAEEFDSLYSYGMAPILLPVLVEAFKLGQYSAKFGVTHATQLSANHFVPCAPEAPGAIPASVVLLPETFGTDCQCTDKGNSEGPPCKPGTCPMLSAAEKEGK